MSIQHRRLQAQVDEKNARIAQLEAELAEARKDNEELDGTDAAHPAWWRGNDYGVAQICRAVNDILDGKEISGVCGEPWESTRRRVAEARQDSERLKELFIRARFHPFVRIDLPLPKSADWDGVTLLWDYGIFIAAIDAARGTK